MARWLGVDVGGRRKGFDTALVDDRRVIALAGQLDRRAVIEHVETYRPTVVAIDSPRCWAPAGKATRDGERQLAILTEYPDPPGRSILSSLSGRNGAP
jgi:predicted nuclease with RNAse H fold